MLAQPVKISQQEVALKTRIEEWAQPKGGVVRVMANQRHLWEELTTLPTDEAAPRVLILFAGEVVRGGVERFSINRVDRTWQIIVVRGRGFVEVIGKDSLSGGTLQPFHDSVEELRQVVRQMLNLSEEFPIEYSGVKPLPSIMSTPQAGAFLDAELLEFTTANDIPAILKQKPGTDVDTDFGVVTVLYTDQGYDPDLGPEVLA